jgi:hypothetical protein
MQLYAEAEWVTVPQLPVVLGSSRNKINRQLAQASANWRALNRYGRKLIVPIVIRHSSQIRLKADRNKRIELARSCVELSGAAGLWIVDSTLNDQEGASTLEARIGNLLAFHQEILEVLPADTTVIGGPYWALNLVLWCRGLVTHPAIGLGNAFQYQLPGGFPKPAKSRIALPSLKRLAIASIQLRTWLERVVHDMPKDDPSYSEFSSILKQYSQLSIDGRQQVATFYRQWLSKMEAIPKPGRALAMYQDLSSAYVIGKSLHELPGEEGSARRPERTAKQLMLFCL